MTSCHPYPGSVFWSACTNMLSMATGENASFHPSSLTVFYLFMFEEKHLAPQRPFGNGRAKGVLAVQLWSPRDLQPDRVFQKELNRRNCPLDRVWFSMFTSPLQGPISPSRYIFLTPKAGSSFRYTHADASTRTRMHAQHARTHTLSPAQTQYLTCTHTHTYTDPHIHTHKGKCTQTLISLS